MARFNPFHGLVRTTRRLSRRLWPVGARIVFSDRYALGHSAVPHDPLRAEHILTFLVAEGLIDGDAVLRPRMASVRRLRQVHTDAYLDSLRDPDALTRVAGIRFTEAELDRFLEVQRRMVGGTDLAVREALLHQQTLLHLGGGLHHAHADRGQGFCILNDVAVAIVGRRREGFRGNVLVVDLDLHHGDGTEAIFAADPTVHTFSIHNRAWQDIEAVASTNVALGSGVDDDTYLRALRHHLPRLLESHRPQLVIYLAGVDPAADDRIGDWRITPQGMLARDLFVQRQVARARGRPPLVVCLAGGYGTRAWQYSARFFSTVLNHGVALEPPSTDAITLERYRQLSKVLDPDELTGIPSSTDWQLTAEDIYGALGGGQPRTRFLDFYSKHGLELVLERSGLLDRLRARGFHDLVLDVDLEDESGETVRLFSEQHGRELLAELRANRDRRLIPGMELLQVEWLLLQNPRAHFAPGEAPLPGQEYPGLGMLRDVVALLVVVCERLHLDGISFVPSHYHLASTSHKVLRFLDPHHEVTYDALQEALAGLSVAEASHAVEAGRIRDTRTGEIFHWTPMAMVLPVSPALQERLYGEEAEKELERARAEAPVFELVGGASPTAPRR
ncbi:MAG: hypothetical protein KDD11_19475, partial [Acidobacteria bacterium]|nr:hypothetical protein [Acidobacteriota bacterium]